MKVFEKKSDLNKFIKELKEKKKKIGFVPTMGALHQGHLALVQNSLRENDLTIVSIFVNPTQFDNPNDLQQYPRTFLEDLRALKKLHPEIIIYSPQALDIYDGNIQSEHFDFDGLEEEMEGKHRPGHFDGVGTIVKKLFEIVLPDRAYFGEKDFQQLQIIKKLVEKEGMPIQIIPVKIYREKDGLAMSSRNKRLSPEARKAAPFIYKTLQKTKELWSNKNINEIKEFVEKEFKNHPLLELEYFEIANERDLKPTIEKKSGNKYRGFVVVYANDIRLIDNIAY
jgi:pantoate--beta-alanine ligase